MTDHMELRNACAAGNAIIEVEAICVMELLAAYDAMKASATVKRGSKEYPAEFLAAYDAMKEAGTKWREGSTLAAAFKQWHARIKAGADPEQVLEGARRYGAYIVATAGEPKMAQTFFGPGEHYTAQWATPVRAGWQPSSINQGRLSRLEQQSLANAEALRRLDGMPPVDLSVQADLNIIDMEDLHGNR